MQNLIDFDIILLVHMSHWWQEKLF